jgi:hypothetical protein
MKVTRTQTIIIFAALTIAGLCLVVFGQSAANSAIATVLPLVGTGLFTAALAYFLVKVG